VHRFRSLESGILIMAGGHFGSASWVYGFGIYGVHRIRG
jgi:hypothetical protein